MTKQRTYNDYQSAWRNKSIELIKQQIKDVKRWASTTDKWVTKEGLTSGEKIDILNGILGERGEWPNKTTK